MTAQRKRDPALAAIAAERVAWRCKLQVGVGSPEERELDEPHSELIRVVWRARPTTPEGRRAKFHWLRREMHDLAEFADMWRMLAHCVG